MWTAEAQLEPEREELPPAPQAEPEPTLPCWLTEDEAETLALLCASSPGNGGEVEPELFGKLGDLLRAFRR